MSWHADAFAGLLRQEVLDHGHFADLPAIGLEGPNLHLNAPQRIRIGRRGQLFGVGIHNAAAGIIIKAVGGPASVRITCNGSHSLIMSGPCVVSGICQIIGGSSLIDPPLSVGPRRGIRVGKTVIRRARV